MKSYNGIVELTVGPLSGGPEITLVKQLAWEQPQTHCVFTGSSGRSVKIWAKFTRPDNSLPQKREEAEIFHAHAQNLFVFERTIVAYCKIDYHIVFILSCLFYRTWQRYE